MYDPTIPANNEIWYTGEYYDLGDAISKISEVELSYVGPSIVSNEQVGNKYVITFNGPVTKLGLETEPVFYPIFISDESLQIQCNITSVTLPYGVTNIGGSAFYGCSSLTSITIPNSVISIGNTAFEKCSSLTSITIPNSVTSIGDNAFRNCSGLTSITIGSSVTNIGEAAFQNCSNLTSITIPNNVTSIEYEAFQDCSNLTSVTIGDGVTSIGVAAFESCSELTSITCNAVTPPELGYSAFDQTNNCPIYVPSQSVDTYKAAQNWSSYAGRIQAIP